MRHQLLIMREHHKIGKHVVPIVDTEIKRDVLDIVPQEESENVGIDKLVK